MIYKRHNVLIIYFVFIEYDPLIQKRFPTPLPFNATQIINRFLNLSISANHDKGEEL